MTDETPEDIEPDDDVDLQVEIEGVPMPAWLVSWPYQVADVQFQNRDGSQTATVTFERLFGGGATLHCTWPRYASLITRPDPDSECGFSIPDWDEQAMTAHAWTHLETECN